MNDTDNVNIRKLDGGLLLVFRELLRERRATAAGRRLGLSQSAVSHALARLRDVFHDPLFLRKSHGLEPTRRALELGPRIEALIETLGATLSAGGRFDPKNSRRLFRIVSPESIVTIIANGLTRSFAREAPQARFSTQPAFLERALGAVRRGEVDLAIGMFGPLPQGLVAEKLGDDEYCVLARRGHPRVKGRLDMKSYLSIGHVFVGNPAGALSDEEAFDSEKMNATYGPLPSPVQVRTHGYVTLWETAMLLAAESDMIVECPRRLARKYAKALGLQILDPPYKPFKFTVFAVRRDADDPGVAWLMSHVKKAFA